VPNWIVLLVAPLGTQPLLDGAPLRFRRAIQRISEHLHRVILPAPRDRGAGGVEAVLEERTGIMTHCCRPLAPATLAAWLPR
jgi:hypothetical protein